MSDGGELEAYAAGRIGKTLRGKYRLDKVIGLGGMAVVYRATHRNQAEFAVKMLHPELSIREDVRTRFIREGYAANSVKHPGVVLVVDDDVAEDGAAFIVMELLDGKGCEAIWEECGGRMPIAAACAVGCQLLDVLAAAHEKGIVHRDLKPANMFVTREGRVKVLDFGIARVRDIAASSATMTGMLLGTPAFMGPEQALAKTSAIDARTDLWAVGATLFTLLSGALVHEAENAQQILIKAATQPARSLSTALPDAPKPIVDLVARALAVEKADRWPDAATMRDALSRACELVTGAAPSASALVPLVDPKLVASAVVDHRSQVAIAETVAAGPLEAKPAPVALPQTTASPVSTDRPATVAKRRSALVAVAAVVAVAAAFGVVGGGKWFGVAPREAAPTHEPPAPMVASREARGAPEPSPSALASSAPASSVASSLDAQLPRVSSAGSPTGARPSPLTPKPPTVVPGTPASASAKPVAVAPAPPSPPKCRSVVDHLDAEGNKIFKKVCD